MYGEVSLKAMFPNAAAYDSQMMNKFVYNLIIMEFFFFSVELLIKFDKEIGVNTSKQNPSFCEDFVFFLKYTAGQNVCSIIYSTCS